MKVGVRVRVRVRVRVTTGCDALLDPQKDSYGYWAWRSDEGRGLLLNGMRVCLLI